MLTLRLSDLDVSVTARVTDKEPGADALSKLPRKLAEVAAYGLATALTDPSHAGTRLRMELITALARVEASTHRLNDTRGEAAGDPLLTTAEAAALLGMSRPHVSMLCDQGLLGEVIRSGGGHRRIRRSAVVTYKQAHAASRA